MTPLTWDYAIPSPRVTRNHERRGYIAEPLRPPDGNGAGAASPSDPPTRRPVRRSASMAAPRRRTTRALALLAGSTIALVTLLPSTGASADTAADQREVKRKRAEVAAQIDTLQAS